MKIKDIQAIETIKDGETASGGGADPQHGTDMTLETIDIETGPAPRAAVIILHGLGADGNDFVPVAHELDLAAVGPVRFVFPHAPTRPVTINGGYVMRAWYDILGLDAHAQREDEAGLRASQALVEALIAREKARGIPAGRIVLAGFSQGCAMTLHDRPAPRRAARRPGRPVGLPAAGRQDRRPSATPPTATRRSSSPTARADPMIPIARARQSRDALVALGHPVEWHEYPMPHSVCAGGDRRPEPLAAARPRRLRRRRGSASVSRRRVPRRRASDRPTPRPAACTPAWPEPSPTAASTAIATAHRRPPPSRPKPRRHHDQHDEQAVVEITNET